MKYKAILFDMDGTLLPMDMEAFTKGYFKGLSAKLAKYGIEPEALVQAVWTGTKAMVKNDGTCSNETAFWRVFEQTTGLKMEQVNPDCIDFYGNDLKQQRHIPGKIRLQSKQSASRTKRQIRWCSQPILFSRLWDRRREWAG